MEILAIFNAKGGVGKTTTAVNLAACLAAAGRRVVVFDLDSQGNATSSLGIGKAPEIGTYDVITDKVPITDALMPTVIDNLMLVGATRDLATVDVDMALGQKKGENDVIRQVVAPVADDTDILIMDCAPTFGTMTINALISADAVFVPSQPSPYAHDGLIRTWTILGRLRTELHPSLKVLGILPTFCGETTDDGEPSENSEDIMAAMRAEFGSLVSDIGIAADSELFTAAAATGLPACVFSPDASASLAYVEVALRLAHPPGTSDGAVIRHIDTPDEPDAAVREAIMTNLRSWHRKADEDGMITNRINVPPVDRAAVRQASEPMILADTGESANLVGSNVAGKVLLLGGALALGLVAFLAGWLAGSGNL